MFAMFLPMLCAILHFLAYFLGKVLQPKVPDMQKDLPEVLHLMDAFLALDLRRDVAEGKGQEEQGEEHGEVAEDRLVLAED